MAADGYLVFIAYPQAERASADELYENLVRTGVSTFIDHVELQPGDAWPAKIPVAQSGALLTAVLVSRACEGSFYQREEIAQAIALFREDPSRHRVVPIYLDDRSDAPYGLREIQSISVREAGGLAAVAWKLASLVGIGDDGASGASPVEPGTARDRPVAPLGSPFRPGMPLYFTDYFPSDSRRRLLTAIRSDLQAGANANLIGERRIGRTSLLNHLHGRLRAQESNVVARVNLQDGVSDEADFYGAVLWGIGQCPLGAESVPNDRLVELERTPVADYAELRGVLRNLRHQTTAVVLIDEFERCFQSAEDFPFPGFFDNIRSLLGGDERPYARAVIATQQPLAEYFVDRQVTSTLPGYLPPRRIELLTDSDVEEVLAQPSPRHLGAAQRDHASRLARSHPCLLQAAGEAWYRALKGGRNRSWVEAEFVRLSEQTCLGVQGIT